MATIYYEFYNMFLRGSLSPKRWRNYRKGFHMYGRPWLAEIECRVEEDRQWLHSRPTGGELI